MSDNYDLQVDMAKEIFLQYDQETILHKFSLEADEAYLYLTYLNTRCRISRKDGGVWELVRGAWRPCREYSTVMTIYDLLCHSKGDTAPALSGQWCTVGNFVVTGVTETEKFTGKFAHCFDGHPEKLKAACEKLGGQLQPSMAGADLTCRFLAAPFFPVLLQFWQGDEEFSPKLLILWDRNTDRFLHFETTFYLQGDLLQRLKRTMEEIL